jgi:hypothetical protein
MPEKKSPAQARLHDESANGTGHTVSLADLAVAETAAPERDLDDALGQEAVTSPQPSAVPNFDLDAALGDEDALKSDMVADVEQPPEVRAPKKREFIMVHPTFSRVATVIEYTPVGSVGRAYYLATGEIKKHIEEEDLRVVRLVLCQSLATRAWFIWPMNVNPDGRENAWNTSSERFAEEAKAKWARRVNRKTGYGTKFAPGDNPPPTWPDKPWKAVIAEAFAGRIIDSPEHPVFVGLERGM